ncbi:vWA domain-containing protein [Lysobacter panacisoli]|uniref:VWA domain-containing protein n=1 Tax=Lysobacter panacisoli TaxID=1255263 RepID=A0ABP9LT18_9GAMM|nr:VWA domain-containing protein [Lysobacter panacisoli]
MDNNAIPDVALVDNAEQRTPLVLVLDCSGSMAGAPIQQLNEGLQLLEHELKADPIAAKRVRVLIVTFGGMDSAEVAGEWSDAMDFVAPQLAASGTTPTGQAIDLALQRIEEEKQAFRTAGVAYTRPWLFLMSDGVPTDHWEGAADGCRQAEAANKVAVFPLAVGSGADDDTLAAFSHRGKAAVKRLDGLKFSELFLWLSASMKVVSQSRPGGHAQLPATDTWSSAPT